MYLITSCFICFFRPIGCSKKCSKKCSKLIKCYDKGYNFRKYESKLNDIKKNKNRIVELNQKELFYLFQN